MGLREHILYFKAAVDIPLGHIVFLHIFDVIISKALSFSYFFHYLKGLFVFKTLCYKITHYTVSSRYGLFKSDNSVCY